ncbi:MAG: alpha/beta hydrolase, partial [Casimicrobiaceae bacterium]
MIPDLPLEELARRYDNTRAVPDWRTRLLPRWQAESAMLRETCGRALGLGYDPQLGRAASGNAAIDVLAPRGEAPRGGWPCLIFIHGGYWQWTHRHDWSFIARPWVESASAVAIIGYRQAPEVTVPEIAQAIEHAVVVLWQEAPALRLDRARFVLSGHSAGGHLAAWCQTVDWPTHGLPHEPFCAAVGLSGVYDLEPLVPIPLNAGLRLTRESALASSPVYRQRTTTCPFHAVVGGGELEEFHRQNRLPAAHWSGVITDSIGDEDHFS